MKKAQYLFELNASWVFKSSKFLSIYTKLEAFNPLVGIFLSIMLSITPFESIFSQGCGSIVFNVQNTSTCCYRLTAQNMTDNCFQQLNLSFTNAAFTSFTAAPGWQASKVSEKEYAVRPSVGFIPFGNVTIGNFCVTGTANESLNIFWTNLCTMEPCETQLPVNVCIPKNVIQGVKYIDIGCSEKPYTNQPVLADWPVDLLDEFGQLIDNTQTDANGKFSFTNLKAGKYICTEGVHHGWKASIPKNGSHSINLVGTTDTSTVNFGNCPTTCSCDSIVFNLNQVNSKGDNCCYELSFNNASSYCFYNIKILLKSGNIESWTLLANGWNAINVSQNVIQLVPPPGLPIPIGNYTPIRFCAKGPASHNFEISTSYSNATKDTFCTELFNFQCTISNDTCCAYSLHLNNEYTDGRVKYVKISGLCDTKICCADPDDWEQISNLPHYIIWKPSNNTAIPNGKSIDNDFIIWLNGKSLNSIQVEWYDQSDALLSIHTISLNCTDTFNEDEDWAKYTSNVSKYNDPKLFAFAVREESEDQESECNDDDKQITSCNFSYSIICSSNNYLVNLVGPTRYSSYNWSVKNGPDNPTIASISNPSFTGTAGSYIISLQTDDGSGNTCYGEEEIIIQEINADFNWEFLPCPTNTKVIIKAEGCEDGGCNYSWSCPTVTNFPTNGANINFVFPSSTTDYPITLVITDIYGCTHTITKTLSVNISCKAEFEVEKYVLCESDCAGQNSASVTVTFTNKSTGGTCPINYDWDFDDPNNPGTISGLNSPTVTHTYSAVPCPAGKIYNVKLTMREGPNNTATCSTLVATDISPCEVDFTYTICPDGKVIFIGNVPGEWDFPGSHSICPWPFSDKKKKGIRKKVVVRYDVSGIYNVEFIGHCENKGQCKIRKKFTINVECCTKNDLVKDKFYFNESNKDYKLKSRFVQRQLPAIHRIKATTKLKIKKSNSSFSYWKGASAYEIEAGIMGKIYSREQECNCKNETTINYTNDLNSNSKKAKKVLNKIGKFRSKTNTIQSTHRVKILNTSQDIIIPLYLGKDCDPFRCWLDWF